MMLQSSSYPQGATSSSSHPRGRPAHLSVSLRHEGPAPGNARAGVSQVQQAVKDKHEPSKADLAMQSSDDSNDSEESPAPNLQRWFDHSNRCPEAGFHQTLEDSKLLLCVAGDPSH
jgi:hypothetical protein